MPPLPPSQITPAPHWNTNTPITEGFNVNQVPFSSQVSLHPQLVQYDVTRDDGANVGFNPVQTVAPGGSRTYQWYAGQYETVKRKRLGLLDFVFRDLLAGSDFNILDPSGHTIFFTGKPMEYGAINLKGMGDVVHHGMHGGIGALIVEPVGATWVPEPGTDAQATVTYRHDGETKSFKEFVRFVRI